MTASGKHFLYFTPTGDVGQDESTVDVGTNHVAGACGSTETDTVWSKDYWQAGLQTQDMEGHHWKSFMSES